MRTFLDALVVHARIAEQAMKPGGRDQWVWRLRER
jgi:hypothetical protein